MWPRDSGPPSSPPPPLPSLSSPLSSDLTAAALEGAAAAAAAGLLAAAFPWRCGLLTSSAAGAAGAGACSSSSSPGGLAAALTKFLNPLRPWRGQRERGWCQGVVRSGVCIRAAGRCLRCVLGAQTSVDTHSSNGTMCCWLSSKHAPLCRARFRSLGGLGDQRLVNKAPYVVNNNK